MLSTHFHPTLGPHSSMDPKEDFASHFQMSQWLGTAISFRPPSSLHSCSASVALLTAPRFRFNTTGVKAFNCAAPHLWNWFTKNLHYSFISIVAIIFFFMFYNHIIPGFNSFLLLFLIAVAWMDIWVCFQKSAMLKCPTLIQKRACLQARWLPS